MNAWHFVRAALTAGGRPAQCPANQAKVRRQGGTIRGQVRGWPALAHVAMALQHLCNGPKDRPPCKGTGTLQQRTQGRGGARPGPSPPHACLREHLEHVEVAICVELVAHVVRGYGGGDARLHHPEGRQAREEGQRMRH